MNMPLNTSANANDPIEQARFNMIQQQIRPWNVLEQNVLDSLNEVRRELFVAPEHQGMAFMDIEIPLHGAPDEAAAKGWTMQAPRVEARMLQDLQIKPTDKVLEIGSGSGYMAALLAHQAREVLSLEIVPELAELARENLAGAGVHNATVRLADGATDALPEGPFDVIVLSGSVAEVPKALLQHLSEGGRFGAIVGQQPVMRATFVRRKGNDFETTSPWDTIGARLSGFAEPSPFKF